jgi:epoxyqueuosine reductase QueG
MDMDKKAAVQAARSLGFDDVRFASTDDMAGLSAPLQPQVQQAAAASIAVLFKAYRPASSAPAGHMPLSAYYVASHFAYHAAKAFAAYLAAHGINAVHTSSLPAKKAALRTGGHMGDNGFYYHPTLGSLVCIQTVLTDALTPDALTTNGGGCLHCGACRQACSSGGVDDISRCLRFHSNALIPDALRGSVYQLLGCERCQAACPQNPQEQSAPITFTLDELLSGQHNDTLRAFTGALMARPRRIASQAALFAANTGQKTLSGQIEKIAQTAGEPLRTHALWACQKLNGEDI